MPDTLEGLRQKHLAVAEQLTRRALRHLKKGPAYLQEPIEHTVERVARVLTNVGQGIRYETPDAIRKAREGTLQISEENGHYTALWATSAKPIDLNECCRESVYGAEIPRTSFAGQVCREITAALFRGEDILGSSFAPPAHPQEGGATFRWQGYTIAQHPV